MVLRHTHESTTVAYYIIVDPTEIPLATEKFGAALGKRWARKES